MSYASFAYGPLSLSTDTLRAGSTLEVSVEVTNTGAFDATEVVQLYLHDVYASVARPVKELKDFRRVFIKRGERQRVTFRLSDKQLGFYSADLQWVAEPGEFEVMVGPNSRDVSACRFVYQRE